MTTLLKFIHLASIAVWSGGLLALPFVFWQRRMLPIGAELNRVHRIARLVYVELTSPAAFIAIASGTGLIFLQATFQEWFSLKMLLVALMAMLHVVAGLILVKLFQPDGSVSRLSCVALACAYAVLITAVVWVVLAKPHIDANVIAAHLFEPGGLERWLR